MTKTTDLAKKDETALAAPMDFGEDVGKNSQASASEIVLPFIQVLQNNSPVVEDKLVPGAEAGQLWNPVTNELFDGEEGILVVPSFRENVYLEFVPRDEGGGGGNGFRGKLDPTSPRVLNAKAAKVKEEGTDFGVLKTPDGNELYETFTIFGMMLDIEGKEPRYPIAFPCKSTKIGPYRNWVTQVSQYLHPTPGGGKVNPPLWAHIIRIKTFRDQNSKGKFFNIQILPAFEAPILVRDPKTGKVKESDKMVPSMAASLCGPGDARYENAKRIADLVEAGNATVDYAAEASAQAGENDDDEVEDLI